MDINILKQMSYEKVRSLYRAFLKYQSISESTMSTAYTDTFYLWRHGDHDLFWKAVESSDEDAKSMLLEVLRANSSGNSEKLVSGYLSHIRRFRMFLASEMVTDAKVDSLVTPAKVEEPKHPHKKSDIDIPTPSKEQVEYYLAKWDQLENYTLQEEALDKLFFKLCPVNTDITDILLKVSALNDFYSTNIFSVYPVAKHILSLDIDERLKAGDVALIGEIQKVMINSVERNFYSFATKYCSHHNPLDFPIYDSYVVKVLSFFRDRDGFAVFKAEDLKNYEKFKRVLIDFRGFYRLDKYNLKEIDKYLWQLGKEFFPNRYGKSK